MDHLLQKVSQSYHMQLCGNESPQENMEVRPVKNSLIPTMRLSLNQHLLHGFKMYFVREMSTWLIIFTKAETYLTHSLNILLKFHRFCHSLNLGSDLPLTSSMALDKLLTLVAQFFLL